MRWKRSVVMHWQMDIPDNYSLNIRIGSRILSRSWEVAMDSLDDRSQLVSLQLVESDTAK
jgi:hypothetical protein